MGRRPKTQVILHSVHDRLAAISARIMTAVVFRWRLRDAVPKIESAGAGHVLALICGAAQGLVHQQGFSSFGAGSCFPTLAAGILRTSCSACRPAQSNPFDLRGNRGLFPGDDAGTGVRK
jgi:hypothetical protein